jgi:hypothetical protein
MTKRGFCRKYQYTCLLEYLLEYCGILEVNCEDERVGI